MRLQVDPQRVELAENSTFTVNVTVTNTGSVIGGYHLRVLGADPSWVTLESENLSLFPDSSQTVKATVEIPQGVGAGDRRIAVQVRELTPPQAIAVAEIELVVPSREAIHLSLSPMTVVCGKHGHFSVIAENAGNTPISVAPIGKDPEAKIRFEFLPAVLDLAPGEHVITDLRTTAKRRWFGSPVVRPFELAAVPPEELAAHTAPPAAPAGEAPADQATEPPPEPPETLAQGAIMQKAKVGRGLLSLLSLLLAVSVFAAVITIAMSRLVGVSAADRDLAIQVASARSAGAGSGSSVIGGAVKRLTDGAPVPGVTVEVFDAGDLTQPIISAATNKQGKWTVSAMPAGSYKVRFRSAGYAEVWYPNALTGGDAKEVQLDAGQKVTALQVTLGGLPASISGQVKGADVAGAVLTVQVPQKYLHTVDKSAPPSAVGTLTAEPVPTAGAANAAAPRSTAPGLRGAAAALAPPSDGGDSTAGSSGGAASTAAAAPAATGPDDGGVLRTIPVGSDGLFTLTDLPSPAVYDLVVSKPGFATADQRVDLSGGESRSGIVLVLRTGDGSISGTVSGPDGPLGNAVVTATSGANTVRTLSLTKGEVGSFSLRNLVTPATYTITVTMPGYTTVTSTLGLTAGQRLTGVLLSLSAAAGSLSGTVTTVSDGKPAPGVTVSIASGSEAPVSTVTQSGSTAGAWRVDGLAIPGTFTITFSRPDLQSQTVAVSLNSAGTLTSGAGASGGIDVAMRSAFGIVTGTVRQQTDGGNDAVGGATITLASGEQTYTVTSTSAPAKDLGRYEIAHVQPGTYTLSASRKGTSPTTVIVTVTAGQTLTYDPVLIQPASISGTVTSNGTPLTGTEVDLYLSTDYPSKIYQQTVTGSDGSYRFDGVDAPQSYVVEARSSTAGPLVSGTIVLAASEQGVLNLRVGVTSTSSSPAPTTTAPTTTAPTSSSVPTTPTTTSSATEQSSPTSSSTPTTSSTTTSATTTPTTTTTSGPANPLTPTTSTSSEPVPLKITSLIRTFDTQTGNPIVTATATGGPDAVAWSYADLDPPDEFDPVPSDSLTIDIGPMVTNDGVTTATLSSATPTGLPYGTYRVTFTRGSQSVSDEIMVDG